MEAEGKGVAVALSKESFGPRCRETSNCDSYGLASAIAWPSVVRFVRAEGLADADCNMRRYKTR